MKRLFLALLLALLARFAVAGEQQPTEQKDDQLFALVKEVQTQQVQIATNQKNIEIKLAELAESIRVARIFASRSR